jgi:hypothetical protein
LSRRGCQQEEIVTLIARFQVDSFEPRQVSGLDADWFGLLTFAKTFTSGITGHATTVFMSAGTEEGSRSYVATERITGQAEDGAEGSVTVQHGGLESDPGTWFGHIVPGTGTACTTTRVRTSRSISAERPWARARPELLIGKRAARRVSLTWMRIWLRRPS